jgi:hypothetical protein
MMQTDVVGILVNQCRVSSITRATGLAVDDNLGVETNWGWCLKVIQDVKAVGNS